MKPSVKLIEALRRAATRIEDPNGGYKWQLSHRCNCGMLYNELLGRAAPSYVGPWRIAAGVDEQWPNQFCEISGRQVDDVVEALMDCGLTRIDIACIERCGDAVVLGRMGLQASGNYLTRELSLYDEPAFVARYFRAQADILEEQLNDLQRCSTERGTCLPECALNSTTPSVPTERGNSAVSEPPQCGVSWEVQPPLQSLSPVTVALAKQMPCHHMWLETTQTCLYCCASKAERKEPACS